MTTTKMGPDSSVVLDACVLANTALCDLYLRLAETPGLYRPRWSKLILEEVRRTQTTKLRRPFPPDLAEYWRAEVTAAFPEALVEDFFHLLPQLTNHEKDRHVLAAAIAADANLIVTFNLRDFPPLSLAPWQMLAWHPQDHLLEMYASNPRVLWLKLAGIASSRKEDLQDVLIRLGKSVPAFSQRLLEDCAPRQG